MILGTYAKPWRVTADGRTVVDANLLLSNPQVQETLAKLAESVKLERKVKVVRRGRSEK
jgi:hypothetical protein